MVASDPDSDRLSYAWSQVSGSGTATFATPDATDSAVSFSVRGAYRLRVTITDGKGGSVASDVNVTVTGAGDAAPAPTATVTAWSTRSTCKSSSSTSARLCSEAYAVSWRRRPACSGGRWG